MAISNSFISGREERLAKYYWDRLYKEYAIADLSRYKEKKLGLRWRSKREVISGKGQFACGAVDCNSVEFLRSWEVDFAYREKGEKRNALVKVRLCPACSTKLNHHKQYVRSTLEFMSCFSLPRYSEFVLQAEDKKRESNVEDIDGDSDKPGELGAGNEVWKEPSTSEQKNNQTQRTQEDEFDDYLKSMFL